MLHLPDLKRRLLWHGVLLSVLGLLHGVVALAFVSPWPGLLAPLAALIGGVLLVALGAVWGELRLPARGVNTVFWLGLLGTYMVWGALLLSAVLGTARVEFTAKVALASSATALVCCCVLVLWGLRRRPYRDIVARARVRLGINKPAAAGVPDPPPSPLHHRSARRAVVVFLENKPTLVQEFKILYHSLKHIAAVDTDLVVFGPPDALRWVPSDCVKVEYRRISDAGVFTGYHYINSIACLAGWEGAFLERYDHVLRSDCDTFLTPAWNHFYPEVFTCGIGRYVHTDAVRARLKAVAARLGLQHRGTHNIGSTICGPGRLVRQVCIKAMEISSYLLEHEFRDGGEPWPHWFKGVVLMYAGEIAVNHLVDDFVLTDQLDKDSTSTDAVDSAYHIHCWLTREPFSKLDHEDGKYAGLKREQLNPNIIRDYCMLLALQVDESW